MLQKLVTWFVLVGACTAMLPQLYSVLPKFEYKYSFKGPYLVNSKGQIPFWTHGGSERACLPGSNYGVFLSSQMQSPAKTRYACALLYAAEKVSSRSN